VEQIIANQAAQLSALQTQLSSAKAAYETETKLLTTLKERQTNQLTEIQKLHEELIHAESNLSAVRVEKAELEGVFLRDKEEARELHRKMMDASQEAEKFKQELERVKKEAKQQKGLLAIARKQLSTKESERAKVEKELEEAMDEVASVIAERENVEAELAKEVEPSPMITGPQRTLSPDSVTFAAQQPLPSTPDVPNSASVGRSNNPFDKLSTSPGTPVYRFH
jgi:epidermal growth factor receptor substrate 15